MSRPAPSLRRPPLSLERLEDRTLLDGMGLGLPDYLVVDTQDYRGDRLLVRLREGTVHVPAPKGLVPHASESLGGGWYEVMLPEQVSVTDALALFQADPAVLQAQPDYRISINRMPNDPGFSRLWGLHNTGQTGGRSDADLDAPEAWDITTGTGSIIVAVLDTGVDFTHPDLAGNIWRNSGEIAGNGLDDDGNGYVDDLFGYDFANNDANPMDDHGHGTHVAGTIGAIGNNGYGVTGVAWNVKIMPVKFMGAGGNGFTSNAIRAVNYAVANGAQISNNSWGGGAFDQALQNAIANARTQGHIFVAAAGNSSRNNDNAAFYPSNYPLDNVISVAALSAQDQLAGFSNFGARTVELGAPGVGIYSTLPNGRYGTFSGTSMAAPHVAGALALVWDRNPGWSYRQVIDQVLRTATPLPALLNKTITGGSLNLAAALGDAGGDDGGGDDDGGGGGGTLRGAAITSMTVRKVGNYVAGVRVAFDQPINTATFTIGDVQLKRGSTSYNVVGIRPVSGTGNTIFDVDFEILSALGNYVVTIGPEVRTLINLAMDQDRDGVSGEPTADQFIGQFAVRTVLVFAANDLPKSIDDLQTTVSTRFVNRNDVRIGDLNVQVTLSHGWVGDLRLRLRGPGGQEVTLFNRRGGSGDNLTDTLFDDHVETRIADGNAPYTGAFRPESSLGTFTNRIPYGNWKLFVDDQSAGVTGTLLSWSLIIEPLSRYTPFAAASKEQTRLQRRAPAEAAWFAAEPAMLAALAVPEKPAATALVQAYFQQQTQGWRYQATEALLGMASKPSAKSARAEILIPDRKWW